MSMSMALLATVANSWPFSRCSRYPSVDRPTGSSNRGSNVSVVERVAFGERSQIRGDTCELYGVIPLHVFTATVAACQLDYAGILAGIQLKDYFFLKNGTFGFSSSSQGPLQFLFRE